MSADQERMIEISVGDYGRLASQVTTARSEADLARARTCIVWVESDNGLPDESTWEERGVRELLVWEATYGNMWRGMIEDGKLVRERAEIVTDMDDRSNEWLSHWAEITIPQEWM